MLIIIPCISNALAKSKKISPSQWKDCFDKQIAYSNQNKELLYSTFVLLEVSIDHHGHVTIENYNGNKEAAVNYVVKKLNGLTIKNTTTHEKFIVKYSFK